MVQAVQSPNFIDFEDNDFNFYADYVRDVMRVKFDRNLDQSSSQSVNSQSSFSLNKTNEEKQKHKSKRKRYSE